MEKFFKISSSLDVVSTEELLLRKYDINYVLNLDFEEGNELIIKAYEKEIEDRLWDRWLVDYRGMTKDTFISFDDYKSKIIGVVTQDITTESKEDLLKMADEIERKISQKRGEE